MSPLESLRRRYREVLASVYLHNEYKAYEGLGRLQKAIHGRFPDDEEFVAAVARHVRDERKHYLLFRRYFENRGTAPFEVGSVYSYIDQFALRVLGCETGEVDETTAVEDDESLFRICRLIMMTELRGLSQVRTLMRQPWVRGDEDLLRIFKVIERDEPFHCLPYRDWLLEHDRHLPGFRERVADWWTHYSLMLIRMPLLFLKRDIPRLRALPEPSGPGNRD